MRPKGGHSSSNATAQRYSHQGKQHGQQHQRKHQLKRLGDHHERRRAAGGERSGHGSTKPSTSSHHPHRGAPVAMRRSPQYREPMPPGTSTVASQPSRRTRSGNNPMRSNPEAEHYNIPTSSYRHYAPGPQSSYESFLPEPSLPVYNGPATLVAPSVFPFTPSRIPLPPNQFVHQQQQLEIYPSLPSPGLITNPSLAYSPPISAFIQQQEHEQQSQLWWQQHKGVEPQQPQLGWSNDYHLDGREQVPGSFLSSLAGSRASISDDDLSREGDWRRDGWASHQDGVTVGDQPRMEEESVKRDRIQRAWHEWDSHRHHPHHAERRHPYPDLVPSSDLMFAPDPVNQAVHLQSYGGESWHGASESWHHHHAIGARDSWYHHQQASSSSVGGGDCRLTSIYRQEHLFTDRGDMEDSPTPPSAVIQFNRPGDAVGDGRMRAHGLPIPMHLDDQDAVASAAIGRFLATFSPRKAADKGMHRVLEHLYIGNIDNAYDLDNLKKIGISHVVMCMEDTERATLKDGRLQLEAAGIRVLHVSILDRPKAQIRPHVHGVVAFIHKARANKETVLVHCMLGQSRSAAFVIAYMVLVVGMRVDEAYAVLKKTRPRVKPNRGFLRQLEDMTKDMFTMRMNLQAEERRNPFANQDSEECKERLKEVLEEYGD